MGNANVTESNIKQNGFYSLKLKLRDGKEIINNDDFVKIVTSYKIIPSVMFGSYSSVTNEREYYYTSDFFKTTNVEQLMNLIYVIENVQSQYPKKKLEELFNISEDGTFSLKVDAQPPKYDNAKDDPNWCLRIDPCIEILKNYCCSEPKAQIDLPEPTIVIENNLIQAIPTTNLKSEPAPIKITNAPTTIISHDPIALDPTPSTPLIKRPKINIQFEHSKQKQKPNNILFIIIGLILALVILIIIFFVIKKYKAIASHKSKGSGSSKK